MKSGSSVRFWFKVKNLIYNFFATYKVTFFISVTFLLFGVFFGAFIVVNNGGSIDIENIFDENLISMLTGDRGVFGLFFSYLFFFSISFCVVIFLNIKPWMMIFSFCVILVNGYIIGYNVSILIVLFGGVGFFNAVIIYIPLQILYFSMLLIISAIAIKRALIIKKYGCSYWNNYCGFNVKQVYFWLYIVTVVILFLNSLLMPAMRITIIL